MKVALVYDRVNKWGGAERVLLTLHEIFPDAPLYTSVYDKNRALWAKDFNVRTSFLQHFPLAKRYHELYALLMPVAFESFTFDEFDLVLSVTSEAAKGIIAKPSTLHISYVLTPTRYLWSGYEEYFSNPILKFASKPLVKYLRIWDKTASKRPDKIIAISKEVKNRIKRYYDLDSIIINPPLRLESSNIRDKNKTEDYFLIVSRLVPYKKIDLAIKVFNKLELPLKIIGIGSEEKRLKKIANENIEFLGYLTDKELVKYYKGCRALVFPGKEDFGLTIVEAQSFGKPVIAFRGGGARESILEGKTGIFFDYQTQKSLEESLGKFMKKKFNPRDCINQANRFNIKEFKMKFEKIITESVRKI